MYRAIARSKIQGVFRDCSNMLIIWFKANSLVEAPRHLNSVQSSTSGPRTMAITTKDISAN